MKPYQARIAIMQSALRPAAKFVAIRILDAQGLKDGACTLSVARLAEDCGLPVGTAKRALRELAAGGVLTVDGAPGARARRRLDLSALVVPPVAPVAPMAPVSPVDRGGATSGPPGVSPVDRGGATSGTSYREGSERDLEKDLRGAEQAPKTTPNRSPLEAARSALTTGYARRYEREAGDAWMAVSANHTAIGEVAAWVAAKPEELAARAEAVLDGAFGDEWMRSHRWPWRAIAKDPARYADAGKAAPALSELERLRARLDALEVERNAAVIATAITRAEAIARRQDAIRARIAQLRTAA